MALLFWAAVGAVAGFALAALLSRKFNHRIAPAALIVMCVAAFGVARWADGQPSIDAPVLQAQAFITGCALLGAVAGSFGWLIFTRQRWAMIVSAVIAVAYLATAPLLVPLLARAVAGI